MSFTQTLKKSAAADVYRKVRKNYNRHKMDKMGDKELLSYYYERNFGRPIELDNPQTFNEKLQWLKLYWRDDKATVCADKYAVRDYLKERGYGELLNDLIAVYDSPEEIDFDALPDSFVLKCTHGSACNIICPDKSKLDREDAVQKLSKWMKTDYYKIGREWVYKDIKPRIVCEKFLGDTENVPVDYKFFCFNGEPKLMMTVTNRYQDGGILTNFYDMDFNLMPFERDHKRDFGDIKKPEYFEKMRQVSETLAQEFPFVRMDYYEVDGKLYFGEFTFFPGGGFERFQPAQYDKIVGEWLTLPKKNI